MTAPRITRDLVERFENQLESYHAPQYNETQLRREFRDPFFKALGWDIDNEQGYAEAYKEVIHEDAIRVGEATKAPDYCFRIGGTRKFFIEKRGDLFPRFIAFLVQTGFDVSSLFAVGSPRFAPESLSEKAV
jgi:hypothetical protein